MTAYVVVMGDTNVDMVIHLPDRTTKPLDLSKSFPQLSGGGTAGNTTAALAKLEIPAAFMGSVGDDGFGRWLVADLQRDGVDIRGLKIVPDAFTVQAIVIVEPDGERLLTVFPSHGGAHTLLAVEDLNRDLIAGAAWLHTSGMGLRPGPMRAAMLAAMQQAHSAGIPVSFDLNLRLEMWGWGEGFAEAMMQAVTFADVIFGGGRDEIIATARQLSGAAVDGTEAAARILADGKRAIIARMGADGALAILPEGITPVPAFPATVVNSVGAGDAFDAGFIAARLRGIDIVGAVRYANAVAALKIQRDGARELPTRAEVEALVKS